MNHLPPAPRDHRRRAPNRAEVAEEMFQALEQTTKQVAFQVSREASLQALGPFAALFEEFMVRQAALEDALWYCPKCNAAKFCPTPPALAPKCLWCAVRAVGHPEEWGVPMVQYAYVPKPKVGTAPENAAPQAPDDGLASPPQSDAPPAAEAAASSPADASASPLAASDAPHLGGEGSA